MKKDFTYLEGIDFNHGVDDCYSLARRVYKDFAGLDLRNYARPDDWWINGKNLYVENFKNEGFYIVEEPEHYNFLDAFLIALPDTRMTSSEAMNANHCAIYIGNGEVIHHRFGKKSKIQKYQGMLRNFTTHVIRHKDVKVWKPKPQKIDLMNEILPEKRRYLEEALQNERDS